MIDRRQFLKGALGALGAVLVPWRWTNITPVAEFATNTLPLPARHEVALETERLYDWDNTYHAADALRDIRKWRELNPDATGPLQFRHSRKRPQGRVCAYDSNEGVYMWTEPRNSKPPVYAMSATGALVEVAA